MVESRQDRTDRATRAAVSIARAHGLRPGSPVVLADRANLLVHLGPAPVVARIATTTSLIRPTVADWLARDLAVTRYLADRGAPVVPPTIELPAGPHEVDGFAITFTSLVPHDPDLAPDPAEVGVLLADLHAELAGYPGELPTAGPLDDLGRAIDFVATTGEVERDDLAALRADLAGLRDRWREAGPAQPLHGDAHPGNLLHTPAGPLWHDFEDTWHGPIAWDLACLATASRLDGPAAVAAYPTAPPAEELALGVRTRALFAVAWRFVLASRYPEELPTARATLRDWLG
ncbi:aminoglycoside phosphotransferase family protein [Solihabitans fulvus]|uniref:Aminoglycoside phosphotransferase family protein n=1 Tax=Solihabitans fulvus TaxID=1892852 RepID=A0A5B2WZT0_9PSEU|nr:aminoglycoside phosphotransferase family protein [Solihabitans fulvus]